MKYVSTQVGLVSLTQLLILTKTTDAFNLTDFFGGGVKKSASSHYYDDYYEEDSGNDVKKSAFSEDFGGLKKSGYEDEEHSVKKSRNLKKSGLSDEELDLKKSAALKKSGDLKKSGFESVKKSAFDIKKAAYLKKSASIKKSSDLIKKSGLDDLKKSGDLNLQEPSLFSHSSVLFPSSTKWQQARNFR